MPGILGYKSGSSSSTVETTVIERMAKPICYSPNDCLNIVNCDSFAGAAVDYGEGFSFMKSSVAQAHDVCLFIDGEVFPGVDEVPQSFREPVATIQRAKYCLHLYLKHGPTFVRYLNGSFAIAVHDSRDQTLHLYTDRFLSRPLFFWHRSNDFAFASSVRTLLCCRDDIGREYDHRGIAEFVGFERILSERTLFADIRRLPPAAHAVLSKGMFAIEKYFSFDPRAATDLSSWQDAGRELARLLKKSLEKRFADDCRIGLFLSGGIDSRLLLALAPDSVTGLTFTDGGVVSKEHRIALKVAKTRGIRWIELPRTADHTVLKAHASVDINEGLSGYSSCRCISFFDKLAEAGIQATICGLWSDETMKGYFVDRFRPQLEITSPPECVRNRAIARMLSDGPLIRRVHHLDLLSLALSDDLKDVLAIAKEHQVRRISEWVSAGGRIGDLSDRFVFENRGVLGGYEGFFRTNRTRFIERTPFYDNELADLAMSIPHEWKRGRYPEYGGRLVRYALREVSPELAKIEDPRTGLPAGLCPPWDAIILGIKDAPRNIFKRSSWCKKVVRSFRKRGQNVHPFTQGAYHDVNGLLKFSPAYQELVRNSVDRLPSELFNIEQIQLLLKDDLSARKPRLGKLWEPLVAFSLFDAKWGPHSDRSAVNCYLD